MYVCVYIYNIYVCVCVCVYIYFYMYKYMYAAATAAAKSYQSCPTLCDPIDSSPPGSSIPGILQARILEWAAISFSKMISTLQIVSMYAFYLMDELWAE